MVKLLNRQAQGLGEPARSTVEQANARFLQLLETCTELPPVLGIVLAGGAASRFRPLTSSRQLVEQGIVPAHEGFSTVPWAKPALPLYGKPLINYTLEDLVRMGCRFIILNVSLPYAPDQVAAAVGDGAWLGTDVAVAYLVEEVPTGTYGGVMHMLELALQVRPFPAETAVAIFSGDIYTTQAGVEILQLHRERDHSFTLMLNPVADEMKGEFGTVILDEAGQIVTFREKDPHSPSNLNNSSRYVARLEILQKYRELLTPVPTDKARHQDPALFFDFGMHLFPLLLRQGHSFGGFVSRAEWADLGRVADYLEAELGLLREHGPMTREGAQVASEVECTGPCLIDGDAQVSGTSRLDHASVGRGWVVHNSELRDTVLLPLPAGLIQRVEGCRLDRCVVACGDLREITRNGQLLVSDGSRLIAKAI